MQIRIPTVLLVLLAVHPTATQAQDGYPIPAGRLEYLIEDGSTVDLKTIHKLIDGGFPAFYHGTFENNHLFHYNWYTTDTDMNPWFRAFRCSDSEISIPEADITKLESGKMKPEKTWRGASALHISQFTRREVLSVDLETGSIKLAPPYSFDERMKDVIEDTKTEQTDLDSLLIHTKGENE